MKMHLRLLCLSLPVACLLFVASVARADSYYITGDVWFNGAPTGTVPTTAPTTPASATFLASSFNFNDPNGPETVSAFLNSGSVADFTCAGGGTACGSTTNLNDLYEFTGTTYLVAGQTYYFTHDDGMYLYLDGSSVATINSPGPTSAHTNDFTVSTTGDYSFEVLYTNTVALPAVLESNIAATPEPNSLMLLGSGLLGVAGLARRRFARK